MFTSVYNTIYLDAYHFVDTHSAEGTAKLPFFHGVAANGHGSEFRSIVIIVKKKSPLHVIRD